MDFYITVYFGILNLLTILASEEECFDGLKCFKDEDDVICVRLGQCHLITNGLAVPTTNEADIAQLFAVEALLGKGIVDSLTEKVILDLSSTNLQNMFGVKDADIFHMKMWYSTKDICFETISKEYRGKISLTLNGIVCQRWDTQTPHIHTNNDISKFPDTNFADAANHCRDPDGTGTPWCYTTSPDVRREDCDVLHCEQGCFKGLPEEYSGNVSLTSSGIVCQRWDTQTPHSHTNNDISKFPDTSLADAANHCRDPDGTGTPWCYTTSPDVVWEHCGLWHCDQVVNRLDRYVITLILPPQTPRFSMVVREVKNFLYEVGQFPAFGLTMEVPLFWTYKMKWDGIKTVIRFQLLIEYYLLKDRGLRNTAEIFLQFLSETFRMDEREIYDLRLIDVAGKIPRRITVEFSLPPLTDNLQYVLQDLETFVNKPCNDVCQQTNDQSVPDNCDNCEYVTSFGDKTFPLRNTFESYTTEWIGNETRGFDSGENCPEYQEICIENSIAKCVRIGTCEKHAYKTILINLAMHGDIKLFDLAGIDTAIAIVRDSTIQIGGFCANDFQLGLYSQGRQITGIRALVGPFLNRKESMEKLEIHIDTYGSVEYLPGFSVQIVNDSFTKEYLDIDKPDPLYIDNGCFGCESNEVWCILPDKSLCLQKKKCIEESIPFPKFANDTDFVRVSILVEPDTKNINITDDDKMEIRYQIADLLLCPVETVVNLEAVRLDLDTYEIVLELFNQGNLTELESLMVKLHRLADTGSLHLYTFYGSAATLTSVPQSLVYRQLIHGFVKPNKDKQTSESFGNAVVAASISTVLIIILLLVTMLVRFLRTKPRKVKCEGKISGSTEKTPKRQPEIQTVLRRRSNC